MASPTRPVRMAAGAERVNTRTRTAITSTVTSRAHREAPAELGTKEDRSDIK